jgi:hypothetical protein
MVETLTKTVGAMRDDNQTQMSNLQKQIQDLSDIQAEDRKLLHEVVKQDSNGRPFIRFDTSSENVRSQVQQAVVDYFPKQGTIYINNQMETNQTVSINGETIDVMANSYRKVSVPLGPFSIQLKGRPVEHRYIGIPQTEISIPIRPEPVSRTTTWSIVTWPYYTTYIYR